MKKKHNEGIDGMYRSSNPINHLFVFLLKSSKKFVLDDQYSAIVLIEMLWIGSMEDAIMRRRIECRFNRFWQLSDQFFVQRGLMLKNKSFCKEYDKWIKSGNGQRN